MTCKFDVLVMFRMIVMAYVDTYLERIFIVTWNWDITFYKFYTFNLG